MLRAGYQMPHKELFELFGELMQAGKLPSGTRRYMHLDSRVRAATLVLPAGTDVLAVLKILNEAAFAKWYGTNQGWVVNIGCLAEELYDSVLTLGPRR